jgi:peptide subunit release factor 1 (eRF1)
VGKNGQGAPDKGTAFAHQISRQETHLQPASKMVTRDDIQTLIHRQTHGKKIVSVFLDTSVDSDNKRHNQLFLNQQKSHFAELESDRPRHHREALGEAFERIERWLDEEYNEQSKGVALYVEIGGDWMLGIQVPVPFENRFALGDRPVVGPLAEIVEKQRRHVIALLDREHFRMLAVYLGEVLDDREVETEPYPSPHDVQKGGTAQPNYQHYKAEETHRFYKEFVQNLSDFYRQHAPDDLILLGTEENVKNFMELLPAALLDLVVHTAHASVAESAPAVLQRLEGFFIEQVQRETEETLNEIRDRVKNRHLASSGAEDTLVQLQEGKVDRLVVARDMAQKGSQCQKCGFFLARQEGPCPYCGGHTENGVDLAEAMIWIAQEQDVPIEFAGPGALSDLDGVGAFLKF